MATIKISAWDIAEALGLRYESAEWNGCDCYYVRKFSFHGKEIIYDSREDDEDSKESVAEELLLDIGKKLAGMI